MEALCVVMAFRTKADSIFLYVTTVRHFIAVCDMMGVKRAVWFALEFAHAALVPVSFEDCRPERFPYPLFALAHVPN